MSAIRRAFHRHRGKLVPASILLGLIALTAVFWRPMIGWFAGKPASTNGDRSEPTAKRAAPAAPVNALPKLAKRRFGAPAFARLQAAFAAYEQTRALLARDALEGLDAQSRAVRAAIEAAARKLHNKAPDITPWLRQATAAATELAASQDLEQARRSFGQLSMVFVALASADERLSEGYHIFKCPMAKGFPKWFQRSPRLSNPYMGKRMPECGVRTDWTILTPGPAQANKGKAKIAHYTCSMHPSVKRNAPGKCPICSMDLTPVTAEEVRSGTIFVDEVRRQRIGVRTAPAKQRELSLQIRAVGKVTYDETRLSDVNLRTSGWVERLLVEKTGQRVRRGQVLFSLYSPELYAAQLEYLSALKRRSTGAVATFERLTQVSHQRLRLLGMNEAQIRALGKRGKASDKTAILAPASGYIVEKNVVQGARVKAGTQVYRIADLSRVWIDAQVFESELPHVRVGEKAIVELPYVPGKRYAARVDYVYPTLQKTTRTGRVRLVLKNRALALKPDMYANVKLVVALGKRLAIPESAVIYTGPRRLVFVDLGEGRLRPRLVELGVHGGGYYEVTKGLKAGEIVVTSGNFLIAAESRIRSAAKYWTRGSADEAE